MGCAKKLCENRKQLSENHYVHVEEWSATQIFYPICAVVLVFSTRIRIKENKLHLFYISTSTFSAEKGAFFRIVLYKIGKKLSP